LEPIFQLVGADEATCPSCHSELRGFPFLASDRQTLLREVETKLIDAAIARRPNAAGRIRSGFDAFRRFITSVSGRRSGVTTARPFCLIDGANTGFYGLSSWYHIAKAQQIEARTGRKPVEGAPEVQFKKASFANGGVDVPPNMHFVDLAVEAARALGYRPLVLLHERHLEPRNVLPSARSTIERWRARGEVYATPSGLNDDICWLWAAVHESDDTAGQIAMVLTNDAMRDHHFGLLSHASFLRFRDRRMIRFSAKWDGQRPQLTLHVPPRWSPWMQKASLPSQKEGSTTSNNSSDVTPPSSCWHVPVSVATSSSNSAPGAADASDDNGSAATSVDVDAVEPNSKEPQEPRGAALSPRVPSPAGGLQTVTKDARADYVWFCFAKP
jgi:ribonuclease P protein 3